MNAIVERALPLWGLADAPYALIADRENAVFRVDGPSGPVALRLHRAGYRSDVELASELDWMAAVAKGGLSVPAPLASRSGEMLHVVQGIQVDVLGWLGGDILRAPLAQASPARRAALFHQLGSQMAQLHSISDAWSPPSGFTRAAWDRAGLLGDAPLWVRFWGSQALTPQDRTLFKAMRAGANTDLAQREASLDFGLIHADLVSTNVLIESDRMHLIDFDDGGYGFRLFELATALCKMLEAPDYPALRAALIAGYTSQRAIELGALDLMILLRAATYVGWNISRMKETDGAARNAGLIKTTQALAASYLNAQG